MYKLHIYLYQFNLYFDFTSFIDKFKVSEYIFGPFVVFFFRICSLTYEEDLVMKWVEDYQKGFFHSEKYPDFFYIIDNERDHTFKNKHMVNLSYKCLALAKKYVFIRYIFMVLFLVSRFLYIHSREMKKYAYYFIYVMIFTIDIYNKSLDNIFLLLFLYVIIRAKHKYEDFLKGTRLTPKYALTEYFYENANDYSKQRLYFYESKEYVLETTNKSKQDREIADKREEVIDYILNNFQKVPDHDVVKKRRHINSMYKRFFTLLYLSILGGFAIYNYNYSYVVEYVSNMTITIVITIPLIIMSICHYKSFYIKGYKDRYKGPFKEDHGFGWYTHTKEYNIAFWILALILLLIYWIILIRPHIFFMESEVLWNHIITIKKVYTIEEKIMYIYQYFDHYVSRISNITEYEVDNMRYLLRQMDFSTIISENTTIKMIREYIQELPQYHTWNNILIKERIKELSEMVEQIVKEIVVEERKRLKPWLENIRQSITLMIIVGTLTITTYHCLSVLEAYRYLSTLKNIKILRIDIADAYFYKTLTGSALADKIMKFYKVRPPFGFFAYVEHFTNFWITQGNKVLDFFATISEYIQKF
jgi:hypothetical protein